MRQVAQIMGMPITIDIPDCSQNGVFEEVFKFFKTVDSRFSPFRNNSELSIYNQGRLKFNDLSHDMKKVIRSCREASLKTNGYFSAWYGEQFDPSGYVKGWAIKEANRLIKRTGFNAFCISAGGDILASSNGEKIWKIGLQDPQDRSGIIETLAISSGAVATSGSYERGGHIINPKTGEPASGWLSLTVAGKDIVQADILATAGFAMGRPALDYIQKNWPKYSVIAVTSDGQLLKSSG